MTQFYCDREIEVTDVAVKTATDAYPLKQIMDLRAEHRLWKKESEPVLALLFVGFVWLFALFVERISPIFMPEAALSIRGAVMAFLSFVSCVFLFLAGVRLIRGNKYHLSFNQYDGVGTKPAFVTLAEADELERLEKIATAIREARAALR